MRRRDFVTLLGGAAAVWPLVARAQQVGRIYRIGGLHQAPHDAPHHAAFFAELQRVGIIEGQNLIIDRRGYGQRPERFAELVQEQIKAQLDVILCGGEAAGRAAQQATTTIPIIVLADDMIRSGLVRSLAQPGGNTTGVSILASELDGKRQEILTEAVPGLRNMAILADPNTTTIQQLHALRDMTQVRGVEVSIHQVTRSEEIEPAIDAAKTSGASALNVLASPLLFNNRQIVLQRVEALRLPAIYQWPEMADQDGLLAYGPRIVQIYRDIIARQLVKILHGSRQTSQSSSRPALN